jgi:hypothetical protein
MQGASRNERRAMLRIFALVVFALAPGAFFGLPPSAGKNVGGALRVLDGEWPYRDFWTMYAPGQFFATAGLFVVFGRDVLVQSLATVLVRAASATLVFAIARRLGASTKSSLLVTLIFAASFFETSPELGSYPPALLAILFALERLLAWFESQRAAHLVQSGALFGLAACFKHDVAAYSCAATAVGLTATEWREHRALLRSLGRFAAGAAAVVAPVAALLAWKCGADAWRDLFVFPAGDFIKVRSEPYPTLLPKLAPYRDWIAHPTSLVAARDATSAFKNWALAHAPEFAAAVLAARWFHIRRAVDSKRFCFACIGLLAMPLYWCAAHVQQNTHFESMAIMVAIAWFALGPWTSPFARRGWVAAWSVYAIALCVPAGQDAFLALSSLHRAERLGVPGARFTWISHAEADVYRTIANFVRANTRPGDPIYCGVARHDAIVVGNQRWHLLCDRPFAVRYNELHPGVTDREDVEQEMIADIDARKVACIVLWRFGWSSEVLDRIKSHRRRQVPRTGATLLDDYIAHHYEIVLVSGEYAVSWRLGAKRPWEK